jgi:hypothetical protein
VRTLLALVLAIAVVVRTLPPPTCTPPTLEFVPLLLVARQSI